MAVHLLINRLLDRRIPTGIERGLDGGIDEAVFAELAAVARQAEVFDFGKLHLEELDKDRYSLPALTPEEQEWFERGLIPFPAPVCAFEYRLETRSLLLVDARDPKHICASRIDQSMADGIWIRRDRATATHAEYSMRTASAADRAFLDDRMRERLYDKLELATHIEMAKYLSLMINSRTTAIKRSDPVPPKLAAARRRDRKSEIKPYSIVDITPPHHGPAEAADGHGAPKRLHWRRSHLRRYEHATPRSVWLDEPGRFPPGHYTVIPRTLIGRRDMAEVVPHLYRVQHPMGE